MTDELDRTAGDVTADGVRDEAGTAAPAEASIVPGNAGDASLLRLIDRLGSLLELSDLTELEVEVGATALVLRKPSAIAAPVAVVAPEIGIATAPVPASTAAGPAADALRSARPSIAAPLTGIWYASPAPGSAPFVDVGREVAVGQVVGLIEAMKLFNEIVAEQAGVVRTICLEDAAPAEFGQLLFLLEP
jgi:acetyl-CoA carboxylase biotin carboxyl carrier protein